MAWPWIARGFLFVADYTNNRVMVFDVNTWHILLTRWPEMCYCALRSTQRAPMKNLFDMPTNPTRTTLVAGVGFVPSGSPPAAR